MEKSPVSDVIVVSDLHLGSGLQGSGTYSRHEEFFYDHEFAAFTRFLIMRGRERGLPQKLILNGDIMDFLAIRELPDAGEGAEPVLNLRRSERKFGMGSSETKAAWKTLKILKGHSVFFEALVDFLLAGNTIVWIRGNHDLEMHWPAVREEIVNYFITSVISKGVEPAAVVKRLEIHDWFYHEPGRLFIEHGNQYDPTNALEAPLVPLLPEGAYDTKERLLDYPVGSLFARFVYGPIRSIDPYRTHVISFAQYLSVSRGYNLLDFLRTLYFNFPFFLRAVRNSTNFGKDDLRDLHAAQKTKREAYAATHQMDPAAAKAVDELRSRPMGLSSYQIFSSMFRPFVRQVLKFSALALLSVLGWILLFSTVVTLLPDSIVGRASLMGVLAVLTVVGIFFALTKIGKSIDTYTDPLVPDTRVKAREAARLTGAPIVVMGHTHIAEIVHWPEGTTYVNSGTWVPVPGPWDQLQPRARQFTFVDISDDTAELSRWDTQLNRPVPPVILSDEEPATMDRVMGGDFFN
ncbi:metallophosphoesterase [Myxococcota bacterium]|nr:metallophosphoesterase [Myxococcota bacterium]